MSPGPPKIRKVTIRPIARKAASLTTDFHRHRQHQPVLVLGGVGVARAEQHREQRKQHGDDQRDVADERIEVSGGDPV